MSAFNNLHLLHISSIIIPSTRYYISHNKGIKSFDRERGRFYRKKRKKLTWKEQTVYTYLKWKIFISHVNFIISYVQNSYLICVKIVYERTNGHTTSYSENIIHILLLQYNFSWNTWMCTHLQLIYIINIYMRQIQQLK